MEATIEQAIDGINWWIIARGEPVPNWHNPAPRLFSSAQAATRWAIANGYIVRVPIK